MLDNGFLDVIRGRNAMAKRLGYADFYDYKVTQAEGFGKTALFEVWRAIHSAIPMFSDRQLVLNCIGLFQAWQGAY